MDIHLARKVSVQVEIILWVAAAAFVIILFLMAVMTWNNVLNEKPLADSKKRS